MEVSRSFFGVPREYQALLCDIGLIRLEDVFTDPRIIPWRSIPERENCTLDLSLPDGRPIRLHVKRYHSVRAFKPPGEQEADGINRLKLAGIPTAPLVAWGKLEDGRSFVITEDLAGYQPGDKLIEAGILFEKLLFPTAQLAAKLHSAGLHHRDLYLCHFFIRLDPQAKCDVKLIDAARVQNLPAFFRSRWIVKDLAQFWYSAQQLSIPADQLDRWLAEYAKHRQIAAETLKKPIARKVAWIERHDRKLREKQPNRNVSIPS